MRESRRGAAVSGRGERGKEEEEGAGKERKERRPRDPSSLPPRPASFSRCCRLHRRPWKERNEVVPFLVAYHSSTKGRAREACKVPRAGGSLGRTEEKRQRLARWSSPIEPWHRHLFLSFFGGWHFRARSNSLAIAHRDQDEAFWRASWNKNGGRGAELGEQILNQAEARGGGTQSSITKSKGKKQDKARRTHREARLGRDRGVNSHRRSLVREKRDGLADSDDEKKNKKWRAREKERPRSNSRSVAKLSGVLWRGAPHRLGSGGGGGVGIFLLLFRPRRGQSISVANQSAFFS